MLKDLTELETKSLVCQYGDCKYVARTIHGLKIHKSVQKHWVDPDNPVVGPLPPKKETIQDLPPSKLGVKEITIGSRVELDGPASNLYWRKTPDDLYLEEIVVRLPCQVVAKIESSGISWLGLVAEGGTNQWVCKEQDVLGGKIKMLSLGKQESIQAVPEPQPEPEPVQEPEPIVEPPVESGGEPPAKSEAEPPVAEFEEPKASVCNRVGYIAAVKKYAEARDLKLKAEEEFNKVDEETRPVILAYLEQFGIRDDDGLKLFLGGYNVVQTITPGKMKSHFDEDKILDLCWSKKLFEYLAFGVNTELWAARCVGLVADGIIPETYLIEETEPETKKLFVTYTGDNE